MAGAGVGRTLTRVSRERYDSAEELLYVPVTVAELDRLYAAAGKPLLDKYAIKHFLYRARHTLLAAEEGNRELTKALDIASERKRRQGTPTTLTPIDAVKFASPDELSVIVGNISSTQLKALAAAVEDAQHNRDTLAALLSATAAHLNAFVARADLPAEVRAHVAATLAALPEIPAPVQEPPSLELGRLAGLLPPKNGGNTSGAVAASTTPLALEAAPLPSPQVPDSPQVPVAPGPAEELTTQPTTDTSQPTPIAAQTWYGRVPAWVPDAAGLVLADPTPAQAATNRPPTADTAPVQPPVQSQAAAGHAGSAHTVTVQVPPPPAPSTE